MSAEESKDRKPGQASNLHESMTDRNFEFLQFPKSPKMSQTASSFAPNLGGGGKSSALDRGAMDFVARHSGIQRLLQQSMAEASSVNFKIFKKNDNPEDKVS